MADAPPATKGKDQGPPNSHGNQSIYTLIQTGSRSMPGRGPRAPRLGDSNQVPLGVRHPLGEG